MKNDAIVVGAGIWGCTVARRLAEAGKRVRVLEKRAQIGGNCACEVDPETGIEIHTYGSHIFHTKSEKVWEFVRRFTDFNDYRHSVLANYRGKIYHLPFGCTLLKEFFGKEMKPSELNEADKKAIFDAFIRGYTSKQWGVPPEKVDPSVIARLKVRDTYSTDYFDDPHQGIPLEGYNKMFERMLDHPNIEVRCNMEFVLGRARTPCAPGKDVFVFDAAVAARRALPRVYYSGPIDKLFDYKFGPLPWRSLRFETEKLPVADYQHNSVVNYTEAEVPYTRIHEFRHYHPESNGALPSSTSTSHLHLSSTVIMREYSKTWEPGDEPYYPINNPDSAALLAKYQREVDLFSSRTLELSNSQTFKLILGGRLGQYKYYDMDQAMLAALEVEI